MESLFADIRGGGGGRGYWQRQFSVSHRGGSFSDVEGFFYFWSRISRIFLYIPCTKHLSLTPLPPVFFARNSVAFSANIFVKSILAHSSSWNSENKCSSVIVQILHKSSLFKQ